MNFENHNGTITITTIRNNQLVKQRYIGYTLASARREFISLYGKE